MHVSRQWIPLYFAPPAYPQINTIDLKQQMIVCWHRDTISAVRVLFRWLNRISLCKNVERPSAHTAIKDGRETHCDTIADDNSCTLRKSVRARRSSSPEKIGTETNLLYITTKQQTTMMLIYLSISDCVKRYDHVFGEAWSCATCAHALRHSDSSYVISCITPAIRRRILSGRNVHANALLLCMRHHRDLFARTLNVIIIILIILCKYNIQVSVCT